MHVQSTATKVNRRFWYLLHPNHCVAPACSNDAFDASTGVDVHKAESVVNLTGNRTGVLLLSKLFLAAGLGLLSSSIAAATQTDGRVTAMLAAAIACGYVYQGPPFR